MIIEHTNTSQVKATVNARERHMIGSLKLLEVPRLHRGVCLELHRRGEAECHSAHMVWLSLWLGVKVFGS